MKKETINMTGCDGFSLQGILWMPQEEPKAMLQIVHGMTEHMGRYETLAEVFTAKGIAVAGFDLRGHGKNPGDAKCASFGEGGWEASLADLQLFSAELKRRYPGCSHFMLGFSLGSFLMREYLQTYDTSLDGAVILGTGHQPGMILFIMMGIVKGQIKKADFDKTTPLVKKLSFETYNQKFAPNRTFADWLCADEKQLDAYLADPLCRENISSGLFLQLLDAMKRTGGKRCYKQWNHDLPVLLLSGAEDAVGDFGKGVVRVKNAMVSAGMNRVSMELIAGARHDLLHEVQGGQAEQGRTVLLDWIEKNCRG